MNVGSMNIDEAMDWLFNVKRFGPDRTLEPTRVFLEQLGNPQNSFKTIHIGGTNGKGSTSAYTASILEAAGYKVGLYTSPHLERFNERIKINNVEISDEDAARLLTESRVIFERMLEYPDPMPLRFFDILTGVCFKYFEEQKVDFGVIEVGLGGRLDATNVINPLVSIITNIGYEHVNILGPTLEDIAHEKAGIIKPDTPIVTGETKPNILDVFRKTAESMDSEFIQVGKDTKYHRVSTGKDGQVFELQTPDNRYTGLHTPLFGMHQIINASVAVTSLETLKKHNIVISREAVSNGVMNVYWPARLEVIHKDPLIILDCAKDAEATEAAKETIKKDLNDHRIIAVVSISSDKNIEGMIKNIAEITTHFILTKHSVTYRAAEPERLIHEIEKYGKSYEVYLERDEAFRHAAEMAGDGDMVLVIGSVYLAGDARSFYARYFSQ
ncbi:bifunctional folylpolyglutamate synthase/dihydrofolate synthase [Candidatus Bathyarchaeota archaeon]|nr:bifunctional folylpolyglutamate synthase/dihydrofolate synthase [Candidatus Bathyarchaeota archaeon]